MQFQQLFHSTAAAAAIFRISCRASLRERQREFVRLAGRDNTDVVPTAVENGHLMLYTASAETLITP